ncbi:MAG: hypothetical protein V4604_01875 [Bacteroidota bacterium]
MAYELDIHYIDVGQGDCTLIVIRDEELAQSTTSTFDTQIVETIVIDCGTVGTGTVSEYQLDYVSTQSATPWDALVSKLNELRVERINKIFVTHFDSDHYNGIIYGLERYANALQTHQPSNTQRGLIRLLQNVHIYDQGMILYKSNNAFTSKPPEFFRLAKNPTKIFDEKHRKEVKNADAFGDDLENFTNNTGFDSVEHTQESKTFKHFSGRENYLKYIELIFKNKLSRETERVMTGHPAQWVDGIGPFKLDITVEDNDNGEVGDEWVHIQQTFWQPTSTSADHCIEENINHWGYRVVSRNRKMKSGTREVLTPLRIYNPREVNVPGFVVRRLSPIHLLGTNLLEALNSQEQPIELTCIAANGYSWDVNGQPQIAYSGEGDDNTFSLGIVLKFGNLVHWFGGDLESEQEDACVPTIKAKTGVNGVFLMKASHHGCAKSSSAYFLKQLKPAAVFISAGMSHGHPHWSTIQRLEQTTSIQHVFMTGTDELKEYDKAGVLPDDFPDYYSIYHKDSRFMIAGSDHRSGNIVLKCSSEEAQNGICTINFTGRNAYMIVDESMPESAMNFSTPMIVLNNPEQRIELNPDYEETKVERYSFISNQKRLRPPELSWDGEFLRPASKKPRPNPFGRILSDTVSYQIKRNNNQ